MQRLIQGGKYCQLAKPITKEEAIIFVSGALVLFYPVFVYVKFHRSGE